MKTLLASILLLCMSSAAVLRAQAPAAPDPQLAAVVKEVQAQQAQIADNEAKIAEKLATITEAVRVARIYSSRGGR